MQEFTDPEGTAWQVYEVVPGSRPQLIPQGHEAGWLVFESATHKCRIVPIPPDWQTCSEEDLLLLLESATRVAKSEHR
ncbi:hypothetical protein BH23GEM5_BH23GEM5_03020 [soil metagenome]